MISWKSKSSASANYNLIEMEMALSRTRKLKQRGRSRKLLGLTMKKIISSSKHIKLKRKWLSIYSRVNSRINTRKWTLIHLLQKSKQLMVGRMQAERRKTRRSRVVLVVLIKRKKQLSLLKHRWEEKMIPPNASTVLAERTIIQLAVWMREKISTIKTLKKSWMFSSLRFRRLLTVRASWSRTSTTPGLPS